MKKILLFVQVIFLHQVLFAQEREIARCGNEFADNSAQIAELLQNNRTSSTNNTIYRIPVVFHVLTNEPNGESNISDCIIRNQVEILNNCFRRKAGAPNTNPAGADAQIEFYLAMKTNTGANTNGINRVTTANCNYTTGNDATQISNIRSAAGVPTNWPYNKYLNIFVLKTMPSNNRVRGQAWYSTGSTSFIGVFVHYSYLGSKNSGCSNIGYLDITRFKAYDLGMTVVHEVAHYLNLPHTFDNCTNDGCSDTPNFTGSVSAGCGTNNNTAGTRCSGETRNRMWQNYMDYADDACMDRFTACQVTRMRNVFLSTSSSSSAQYRNLVSQANFTATGGDIATSINESTFTSAGDLKIYPNPISDRLTIVTEKNLSAKEPYRIVNIYGQSIKSGFILSNAQSVDMSDLPAGIYFLEHKKQSYRIIKQ